MPSLVWLHECTNDSLVARLADTCETVGGETPVLSGLGLVKALEEQAPEFVEKLHKKGVKYVYRYGVETIVSTTGASFIDAYGHRVKSGDDEETVRKKVEAEVRRHSNDFEWHDDGSLSVTHVVPSEQLLSPGRVRSLGKLILVSTMTVIRKHEDSGLTTWFGNLTSAWGRSKNHGATQSPYRGDDGSYHPPPLYGDGTVIESRYLDLALSLAQASQVLIKWQQGDVVLLDVSCLFSQSLFMDTAARPGPSLIDGANE